MIEFLETLIRRGRRMVSRSEWLARLLRLPRHDDAASTNGLVLIQIDGLSRAVLEDAMRQGRMPFLRRLLRREGYRLHHHFAGVPSTTAAVQGELFYGIHAAVPGFNFLDRHSNELVRMFEPTAAARIERELAAKGEPLLAGGSCYADNYTGGAAEPHFCPAALGWGPTLRDANPLAAGFLMANPLSLLRAGVLMVVEIAIAVVDGVRGTLDGHSLLQEMKFIGSRVVISILLRELSENGVRIDVARGLPIIHVNFLGYDEQSHRRGPTSAFAKWSLKGIDSAIARIWGAVQRSTRRHYDIWIYSDHGQDSVVPYSRKHGRSCAEAIAEVFADHEGGPVRYRSSGEAGAQLVRAKLVRSKSRNGPGQHEGMVGDGRSAVDAAGAPLLSVAPLGPMAFIYYERALDPAARDAIGRALAVEAGLPVVVAPLPDGRARAWTADDVYTLPEDGERLLGPAHPFASEVAEDLAQLAHHRDVGPFLACGWHGGSREYVTFAKENGAHGGMGPQETAAFALLPQDVPLDMRTSVRGAREYLRPRDLHRAALRFLGRDTKSALARPRPAAAQTVRIMTYNVHSCIGMDGRMSPERIARVIARYSPDIVCLQELDVGRDRTNGIDQAHIIARHLDMDFHFHPALHVEEERYGDAILTHLPMRLVKADALPQGAVRRDREPRGALWAAIDVGGTELHVLNTHLGLSERERRAQMDALLGPEWLCHPERTGPVVLCGDFNAIPASVPYRNARRGLQDVQRAILHNRPRGTFFGRFAMIRIDHIFVDPLLEVGDAEVPNTALTRVASDHLPLVAELRVTGNP